MIEVDIDNWERKQHFEFFRRMDNPLYNICFDLDISELLPFIKQHHLSLNHTMVFLSIKAANQTENFRYRLRDDKVVLHDKLTPSFTSISKETNLFRYITVEFVDDVFQFNENAEQIVKKQTEYFPTENNHRDDFIYFSSIPWISFTGLDHATDTKNVDSVPRIMWGKFYQKENRTVIPYNLQVNHCFIDGYHLGLFKERLDLEIKSLTS
ncbi:MAG: chloramphenicol acetyltransferase [Gammaproteobacteria bacterium]|nr:chloramphenicol acetyltransferase [Gammaproteobacteria bacterium]MDH5628736.1 chloramphenicol acetyltransferase [Gammaproteobacteria bacterium]